ncbi:MAG TPA: hypothetical protein VMT88_06365 [Actinomycetes bacterium]|nr:hypothetical protein [Actinomycetes bacterium]
MRAPVMLLAGGLLICGLAACTSEVPVAGPTSSPSVSEAKQVRLDRHGVLGDTLESDLGLFTLNDIDVPIKTRDVAAPEGYEVAAAQFTICSNGIRSRSVSPGDFVLSGREGGHAFLPPPYLQGSRLPSLAAKLRGALPSDHCVNGWLAFEVDAGTNLKWAHFLANDQYSPFRDYRGVAWDVGG